jgi:hypothetical protein
MDYWLSITPVTLFTIHRYLCVSAGGLTPLMIASHYPHGYDMAVGGARGGDGDTSSSSSSSSSSGGVEDSAAIISDLISQGASINAHTERTGETSLHLAAR